MCVLSNKISYKNENDTTLECSLKRNTLHTEELGGWPGVVVIISALCIL